MTLEQKVGQLLAPAVNPIQLEKNENVLRHGIAIRTVTDKQYKESNIDKKYC